jgi:hypothetical protein
MAIRNIKVSSFPQQKLALGSKDTAWKEACVDGVIGRAGSLTEEKDRMKTAYDLYNGIFNESDLKYVTNPYKVDDSFPASLQNFNIIRPKINLLLGEESKRPQNIVVFQTSDEAASQVQEKLKEMLAEVMIQDIYKRAGEPDPQDEQAKAEFDKKIQEVVDYVKSDYVSPAEITAHTTLNYLQKKLRLDMEFLKGFKDGLCGGKEIYYNGIQNGEPITERVNPIECDHDTDPDLDNIEDGDWFVRHMKMTPSTIYDRFNDIMTESDLNKVLDLVEARGNTAKTDYARIEFKIVNTTSNSDTSLQGQYVDVYHVVWRSFKKVGFVTITDEFGEPITDLVDESYTPMEGEDIVWDWVTEIWEGYKIGEDIYIGIQPIPYQETSIDNPYGAKLPYVGSLYSNTNSVNRSLVDIMKPLSYMYIIVWYRLELSLSRDKGKIINMDITQIPKSMGVDVNKWLHYLSAIGVNFINPYEEGWDIPGREGGRPAAFNQMSTQDMTMSNVIAGYIELMNKIEEMVGELSGVTHQRQGQISSNELVGNVERSVVQSSHITEGLFVVHNDIKRRVYTALINIAKHAWKNSGKKHIYFVLDDMSRQFVNITDDFLYSDFDVFVGDSTKENQRIESLRSLLQAGMQNGATLLDAAAILTADNMNVIKRQLETIEKRRTEMVAAQQKAEADLKQQETLIAQQQMATEAAQFSEEMRVREEESIRKAETQLLVAQLGAQNEGNEGAEETSPEVDQFQKELERQKLEIQNKKLERDYALKSKQIEEDIRKNKKAEEFKAQEVAIKRKVANKPTPRPAAKK